MSKIRRAKTVRIAGLKIEDPDVIAVLTAVKHLDPINREGVLSFATWVCQHEMLGLKVPQLTFEGRLGPFNRERQVIAPSR